MTGVAGRENENKRNQEKHINNLLSFHLLLTSFLRRPVSILGVRETVLLAEFLSQGQDGYTQNLLSRLLSFPSPYPPPSRKV
jgi:hypothetical protein